MTVIRQEDFVASIARAFQLISYSHPKEFVQQLAEAHGRERSPAARDAIAQILVNARLSVMHRRPICQDTGFATVFLKVGMEVRWDTDCALQEMVDAGVRRAYLDPDNPLRASVIADPLFARHNTGDNTPAAVHVELVAGRRVEVDLAAKGGGSEYKARFAVLRPSESIVDWVLGEIPAMGAGWCPPGILGLGAGGSAEQAMTMAKAVLMEPIDMHLLRARGARTPPEALRIELYERVNALGIGAQGLGGLTTVLDVKLRTRPSYAASTPVALIPNCAATRHAHFVLDGSGPAILEPPSPDDWPEIAWAPAALARRVDLDRLTRSEVAHWRAGDKLLLNGRLLTGLDAAHGRIQAMLDRGEPLPVDLTDRVIYYVAPVAAARGEVIGPAGPTTATRMDDYAETMLGRAGLLAMIGKGERGPAAITAISKHSGASLVAVGGAAYLVSRAVRRARVAAFADLGMEAIHELEVCDMPVLVAVDATGASIHALGPAAWAGRARGFPVPVVGG